VCRSSERPVAWPEGLIPYDISNLTSNQQATVRLAMQRWMDTGARIAFVPRGSSKTYVNFTGRTDAGNNTSLTGFKAGARADINITAFWWRQEEWMPAHELGHVLGFHHEHARWDRDDYVVIHYENIKPGRGGDYDWIPKTNWLVSSTTYDYYSIMHYRVCWASNCESQCRDGDGASPCSVIDPVGTQFDKIIGQWSDNKISPGDAEKARLAYGVGQTVYVGNSSKNPGAGTLDNPYATLPEAKRRAPKGARFVRLSNEGSFSVEP
jgi:tolloid protein